MCIKHANCAPCSRSRACTNTPYLLPFVTVVIAPAVHAVLVDVVVVAAVTVVYFTTSLFAFDKFLKIFQQQQQQQRQQHRLAAVAPCTQRIYKIFILYQRKNR